MTSLTSEQLSFTRYRTIVNTNETIFLAVVAGLSRSKNGVASLAYVPGMTVESHCEER
jgi:hypothetical protein